MKKIICVLSAFLCLVLVLTSTPSVLFGNGIVFSVNGKNVEENVLTYTESDITFRLEVPNIKASNGAFCHIIQGMHVGTNYIYTAKTDDNGNNCVFLRINLKTGEQTVMKYYDSLASTSSLDYSSVVGYADEIVLRSVAENGVSNNYMYVTTGKTPYSLTRHKVYGENMYFTGCFDTVDQSGKSMVCNSVKWIKTSNGYHYFLLKAKSRFYVCKISTSSEGGTVENPEKVTCYLLFETEHKNALFANGDKTVSTAVGIEAWTHNGFEYDSVNNFLYSSLYNKNNSKQSAVVTFSLDGIITDENLDTERDLGIIVFPTKLSFMFNKNDSSYFEVETCGFRTGQGTAGDLSLYFNANADDGKEGIYSLSYKRQTEAFENVVSENSTIYFVEYNGNGSTSGSMKKTTHVGGIKASLRKNAFSREGYSFAGWYFYRTSDKKWIFENESGELTWRTEENRLVGEQKYLGKDMINVYNLSSQKGDTITCFAVWTKNTVSKTVSGNSPIDFGTNFYGKIKINGSYITENNSFLSAENVSLDKAQCFRFVKQTDGSYIIYNYDKNKVFDVSGGVFVEERSVKLEAASKVDSQKFYIYYINEKFYLKPVKSDNLVCVDNFSGSLQLGGDSLKNNNSFEILKRSFDNYLYPTEEYSSDYGTGSVVFIKNSATGKLMTADGNNLVFKDALWDDSQKWNVLKADDGSYSFVSLKTRKAITVKGASMTYGEDIDLDAFVGAISQSFYLHTSPEGNTLIKPVYTTYPMDMDTNNFDVHIYPYGDGSVQKKAQRFELILSSPAETEPDVLVLKEDSTYYSDSEYLFGVGEKTTALDIINSFENTGVYLYDSEGNMIFDNEVVGTSVEIRLMKNGEAIDSLRVLIRGDVDGSGSVNTTDYLRIKQIFIENVEISFDYRLAADIDENGKIDSTDYMRVKGHFIGSFDIFA